MRSIQMRCTDLILTVFIVLGVLATEGCSKSSSNKDKVVMVQDDDADMNAAIAKARETLPHFWQAFDHRSTNALFSLKVQFTDKHGSEHFWLTDIERRDGKIFGTINNDPDIVRSIKLGDQIDIPEQDISDWMYMRGDKMVGNFTLRVLFKQMPPEQVARFKAIVVDP